MNRTAHLTFATTVIGSVLALSCAVAGPASARPVIGDGTSQPVVTTAGPDCSLQRIGSQLVRCGNLTGAGAQAPAWIPQVSSAK